jgi:hypothetical protein
MTLTTPYSATFIVGDGETKTFSYLFEEVSPNFISVMVYNSLTGLISTPTYVIDTDQKQVIFGEDTPAPTADETVCIYRNTPNVQDVAFRTLHGYDAQTLENILSKIVAMIQEIKSNYFSTQVLQGDPWQLDLLSSADDGATVNIDYTAKKLVKGLYFRITSGNLQVSADGVTYLTLPKSDDVAEFRQYEQTLPDLTVIRKLQYRVGNQWFDAEANAQYTADEAYALAESVQTTMSAHINNTQNPHQTSMANLTDTDLADAESGQFLQFDGVKWKAVYSTSTVSWGGILGDIDDQADLKNVLDGKVDKDGDTMTGALSILRTSSSNTSLITIGNGTASSRRWNFLPSYNATSMSVYPGSTETNGFRFASTAFVPASNNVRYLGSASLKWKGVYTSTLNNGADLAVPNKAGTLATMADVELAAQSGTQLYTTGVWYAKMHSGTTPPAEAEVLGRNYADFSGRTIDIYVYDGREWALDESIQPPEYDGYITVTSKIWDIAEQAGQQGGRVLWNHTDGTFTPYPLIVSFEDINVTGDSTVVMPQNPGANQIVNKDYVDEAIASIPTPTIDVAQSIDAEIVGSPTINNDSVVGNLSNQNYLALPGQFDMTGANDFQIVMAFVTKDVSSSPQQVFFCENHGPAPKVRIQVLQSKLDLYIYNEATQTAQTLTGSTTLSSNTKYYVMVAYNGTDYVLSLSTDGVTYNQEATAAAQFVPGHSNYGYIIGSYSQYAPTVFEVYLDGCYIKKNGVIIWQGMDAPGLHQRVVKGHEVIEFQAPTSTNNYTWYRKYADGWVEQGGIKNQASTSAQALTLPVTMSGSTYSVLTSVMDDNLSGYVFCVKVTSKTTTGFNTTVWGSYQQGIATSGYNFVWQVSGMAA